jgi:polysaccharide biosynthesis protein PslG
MPEKWRESMGRFPTVAALALIVVAILAGSISPTAAQRPDPGAVQVPGKALERDRLRAGSVQAPVAAGRLGAAVAPASAASVPRDKIGLGIGDVTVHQGSDSDGTTMKLAQELGGGWMMGWVSWSNLEPVEGQFAWNSGANNDLDNVANAGAAYGLKVLVRVESPPAWATKDGSGKLFRVETHKLESSMQSIAARGKGRVVAYQVFNEPNLDFEWGEPVSPNAPYIYAELLRAAYRGIKAGDPDAIVVSAGLASGATYPSMDDLEYLSHLYVARSRIGTYFDAVGTHPYGGPYAPEETPDPFHPTHFKRAEAQRAIMVDNGDSATPMWATEIGWLHQPSTSITGFEWWAVSPELQADYLKRAFWYAEANWPWMERMFVFNHDLSTAMWCGPEENGYMGSCYPESTSMHWFSILNPDRSPRPAYTALQEMPKSGTAPSPTPTSTATPAPTSTPVPTATSTPVPTATVTPSPTPTLAPDPSFTSSASVSPSSVKLGNKANVTAQVKASTASTARVEVSILDPLGAEVHKQVYTAQGFSAGQTRSYKFSWNVPRSATTGPYTVRVRILSADGSTEYHTNSAAGSFTVQR